MQGRWTHTSSPVCQEQEAWHDSGCNWRQRAASFRSRDEGSLQFAVFEGILQYNDPLVV